MSGASTRATGGLGPETTFLDSPRAPRLTDGEGFHQGEAMAVDIPKLFNEQLPAILTKNADEAKTINATFQMNITGAGSWHLDLTSNGPKVSPGEQSAD